MARQLGENSGKRVLFGGALSAVSILATSAAFAATNINVTSTSAGTGVSGCTLQEAVIAMNGGTLNGCTKTGSGTPHTVTLGANTYLINNRLAPTVSMTIRGQGLGYMGRSFIQPTSGFTANSAVYVQTTSQAAFEVTLQDLTLRRTSGAASVSGVLIDGFWDPINPYNGGPVVLLTRGRITGFNNSGINSNYGNLEINDSIIESNSTASDGAGIRMLGDGQSNRIMRMFRSLVRLNSATWSGGGIYFNAGNNSRIEHTTIAQNNAYSGGGLFRDEQDIIGYLELDYTTIAENDAFSGGGIYVNGNLGATDVFTSIIAYNTAAQGFDLDGELFSRDSLWSATDHLDFASHDHDLLNVDPLLGFIQDLGGNIADLNGDGVLDGMLGYQPFRASPVLDYVPHYETVPPQRDLRGFLRGYHWAGAGTGNDDIGAYEQGPWESERISQFQLSGGTHVITPSGTATDSSFSDGKAMRFRATANNQFVTYRVPIAETGSYQIEVKVRKGSSGAQARLQWSVNGTTGWTNLGGIEEFYTSATTDAYFDYFPSNLTPAGQLYFRWLVTGKHPSSSNRDVITDYIKLIKQ
jgi:hypothetical protein